MHDRSETNPHFSPQDHHPDPHRSYLFPRFHRPTKKQSEPHDHTRSSSSSAPQHADNPHYRPDQYPQSSLVPVPPPHSQTSPQSIQSHPQLKQSHPYDHPDQNPHHLTPHDHQRRHQRTSQGLRAPESKRTHPLAWFVGVFCAILWVIIIIGGLIVLIIYLVYRPKSPQFDLPTASLNAAYLDMGYLLNADLTLLTNFTNPNQKVSVDFISMVLDLYYGQTLIGTQFIEPFSAAKGESMLQNVHMISSQVRLPRLERTRIEKQIESGKGVAFEVKGYFRARSNFGGLLRYSYWLHSDCTFIVGPPPAGVLLTKRCRTNH